MRDSFIFYRSFYEALEGIPNDIRLEIYDAIMQYGLYEVFPDNLSPYAQMAVKLIFPLIDKNNQRYNNGCKGGRPKKEENNQSITEQKPNNNQIITNPKPNDNDNDDDNVDNDIDIESDSEQDEIVIVNKENNINYHEIINRFNEILSPPLPQVLKLTSGRRKAIKSRISDYGLESIGQVFEKIKKSKFLTGKNGGWSCDFDWIFKQSNFIKILEGNYDDGHRNIGSSEKQRANEYALQQIVGSRNSESANMVKQVEKPF